MELIQATLCVVGGALVGGGFVSAIKNSVISIHRNSIDALQRANKKLGEGSGNKAVKTLSVPIQVTLDNETIAKLIEEAKQGEINSLHGRIDKMRTELKHAYARISTLECDLRISKAMQDGYHDKLLALKDACQQGDMFKVRDMLAPASVDHTQLPLDFGVFQICENGSLNLSNVKMTSMDAVGEIYEDKTAKASSVKVDFTHMPTACNVPPPGWMCTRTEGHDGPCAAVPTSTTGADVERALGKEVTPLPYPGWVRDQVQ